MISGEIEESDTGQSGIGDSSPHDAFAQANDEEAATVDRLFADLNADLWDDLLVPAR